MTFHIIHINQLRTDLLVTDLLLLKAQENIATVIGRSFELQRTAPKEQNHKKLKGH